MISIIVRLSQVEARVGEVEALVAQGEIRDLLLAQRERESEPVVEGRIDRLVATETPARIGEDHVTDLAAPALDKRDHCVLRTRALHGHEGRPARELGKLLAD